MDNFSEIISKLISDPAVMNAVSEAASNASSADAVSDDPSAQSTDAPSLPDFGAIMETISSLAGSSTQTSSSRAELLRALKPFLNSHRSMQIDRALSMLSTASAAKSALKVFGGKKSF